MRKFLYSVQILLRCSVLLLLLMMMMTMALEAWMEVEGTTTTIRRQKHQGKELIRFGDP